MKQCLPSRLLSYCGHMECAVRRVQVGFSFAVLCFSLVMLLFLMAHVHCSRALSQVLRQDGRDVPDGETVC